MNGQQTFSDIEYSMRKRTTKREAFLDAMDECIVWDEWCALVELYYFKGKRGRPPMGINFTEYQVTDATTLIREGNDVVYGGSGYLGL